MPKQDLPAVLKEVRESAGLTQRDLADLLGKSQGWVYKMEAGVLPLSVDSIEKWCEECGAKFDYAIVTASGTSRSAPDLDPADRMFLKLAEAFLVVAPEDEREILFTQMMLLISRQQDRIEWSGLAD